MPSLPKAVHGIFAFGSLSAAISSLLISVRLGALRFIKENYVDGLCVDVWDGFFSSPLNLIAIAFLGYLPIHCFSIRAPASMLFLTGLMGMPSMLFFTATFLELMPIILPLGILLYALALFGLAELGLARQPQLLRPSVTIISSSKKRTSESSNRSPTLHPSSIRSSAYLIPSSPSFSSPPQSKPAPPSPISKRKRRES